MLSGFNRWLWEQENFRNKEECRNLEATHKISVHHQFILKSLFFLHIFWRFQVENGTYFLHFNIVKTDMSVYRKILRNDVDGDTQGGPQRRGKNATTDSCGSNMTI